MQNGAQTSQHHGPGRLLGFVRVVVGGHVCDLPVQAVSFAKDGLQNVGGFFESDDQLGILVDEGATPSDVQAQIERATADAVRHLSRRFLS